MTSILLRVHVRNIKLKKINVRILEENISQQKLYFVYIVNLIIANTFPTINVSLVIKNKTKSKYHNKRFFEFRGNNFFNDGIK